MHDIPRTFHELPGRTPEPRYITCWPNLSIWQTVLASKPKVNHYALLPALRRSADCKVGGLDVPVKISNIVKRCNALHHLHYQPHGGGRGEALAAGGQAAAKLGQVHAQQLHNKVVMLLKVSAVKVLAHMRAALHALQHRYLHKT